MTNNNGKSKFGWPIVVAVIAFLVFAYGIIYAVVGTPKTSELAETNQIKIVVIETNMKAMTKQLDRIERKLDRAVAKNGNSNQD